MQLQIELLKLQNHIKKIMQKGLYATLILLLAAVIICLVSPKYTPIWGITALMCFAWIWRSAFIAKNIMYRYIEEEINQVNS